MRDRMAASTVMSGARHSWLTSVGLRMLGALLATAVVAFGVFVPASGAASRSTSSSRAAIHTTRRISGFAIDKIPVGYSDTNALLCSSGTTCTIFGHVRGQAVAWETRDGGTRWSTQDLPGGLYGFGEEVCPSKSFYPLASPAPGARCFAFANDASGQGVVLTQVGGGRWQTRGLPGHLVDFSASSCGTSELACVVIAHSPNGSRWGAYMTSDAGATWSLQRLPSKFEAVSGPDCNRHGLCLLLGKRPSGSWDALVSSDGAASWRLTALPGALHEPAVVDCVGRSHCLVVTQVSGGRLAALVSSDAGGSWTRRQFPLRATSLWEDGCSQAGRCFVIVQQSASRWAALFSSDFGVSWSQVSLPAGVYDPSGASCGPEGTHCLITFSDPGGRGAGALRTTDSGRTWSIASFSAEYAFSPSCWDRTDCVALSSVGPQDYFEQSTDGGASWRQYPVNSAGVIDGVSGVYCTSLTACIVSATFNEGSGVLSTTTGPAKWVTRILTPGNAFQGLSCPASTTCYLTYAGGLGHDEVLWTNNAGTTWDTAHLGRLGAVTPPSCPKPGECGFLAIDERTSTTDLIVTHQGRSWHATSNIAIALGASASTGWHFDNSACTASGLCVTALSMDNGTFTLLTSSNFGTSWKAQDAGAFGINTIDIGSARCRTTRFCWFSGTATLRVGHGTFRDLPALLVTTNRAATWMPEVVSPHLEFINAISCPVTGRCVVSATQIGGKVATYTVRVLGSDGSSMASESPLPNRDGTPYQLSCVNVQDCLAVATSPAGHTLLLKTTDGGAHWQAAQFPHGTQAIDYLKCALRTTSCFMMGRYRGTYVVFQGQPFPAPSGFPNGGNLVLLPLGALVVADRLRLTRRAGRAGSAKRPSWLRGRGTSETRLARAAKRVVDLPDHATRALTARVSGLRGRDALVRALGPLLVFQVGSAAFITDEIVTGDLGVGTLLNIAMFVLSTGISARDVLYSRRHASMNDLVVQGVALEAGLEPGASMSEGLRLRVSTNGLHLETVTGEPVVSLSAEELVGCSIAGAAVEEGAADARLEVHSADAHYLIRLPATDAERIEARLSALAGETTPAGAANAE